MTERELVTRFVDAWITEREAYKRSKLDGPYREKWLATWRMRAKETDRAARQVEKMVRQEVVNPNQKVA
jgi:hypothetical protein